MTLICIIYLFSYFILIFNDFDIVLRHVMWSDANVEVICHSQVYYDSVISYEKNYSQNVKSRRYS